MIKGVKFPAKISLADNQVIFGFKTDEQILNTGVKAKLQLYFASVNYEAQGQQFVLEFADREIWFTSAIITDASGEQYRAASRADDNLTWMKKIAEDLQQNYYVSMLYDISYTWNMVTLTAKTVGSEYNIAATNKTVAGMRVISTTGQVESIKPFFKVYMQVVTGNKVLGEDFLPVDANGLAYFDIGEYLKPEINAPMIFPEDSSRLINVVNEGRIAYYARYGLFYGSEPTVKKLYNTAQFYALGGGVNAMTEGRYNDTLTNYYQQMALTHQFLTWHPLTKKTLKSHAQKLWYLVHTDATEVNLMVKMVFVDSSNVTHNKTMQYATKNVTKYDLLEICCGYDRMMLDIVQNKYPTWTMVNYNVYLTDQNDKVISEIRNFEMGDDTRLNRTFIFRNSFKLWETFVARGVLETEPEYQREESGRIRLRSFKSTDADRRNYLNTEQVKYAVESGWISEDEKRWLSELLLSTEVYEVKNNILYPVVITATKKTPMLDKSFLHNVTIEYVHGYTDKHYSVEKNIIPISVPVGEDTTDPVSVIQLPSGTQGVAWQDEILAEMEYEQRNP